MITFEDKLWTEYPVPKNFSIWYKDCKIYEVLEDLDVLLHTVVDELKSDIVLYSHLTVSSRVTQMPDDCISISSAKYMNVPIQGNVYVKARYDAASKKAYVNYVPAELTYKRLLSFADLDYLEGDDLIYMKCNVLLKMAEKEYDNLFLVNYDVDNGSINPDVLKQYIDRMEKKREALKEEILIYSSSNG